jgi:GTP-binding protein Era
MVLYDTPGVIPKQIRKLDEMMMRNVRTATLNADCVLVVVDACQQPEEVLEPLYQRFSHL